MKKFTPPNVVLVAVLLLTCMTGFAAGEGPVGPTPRPQPSQVSQAGSGFLPCVVAFLGVKLSPKDAKGVTVALDNIQLRITKVADRYEMEPIGIPGPRPADFKPPKITVGETDVTYDTGPMAVTWRMDQVFDLPKDWATVERLTAKGPMPQGTITIVREKGTITLTADGPGSRPETWIIKPF